MPDDVTYLGYVCPQCEERVVVLCSFQHPPIEFVTRGRIESKCKCGLGRTTSLGDIKKLDVWTEYPVTA